MKLLLILLSIIQITLAGAPACLSDSFCQKCDSGESICAANGCFTWGFGTNKDKAWEYPMGKYCIGTMPAFYKVTNCKVINDLGSLANFAGSTVIAQMHPRCTLCDNTKFLTFAMTAVAEECTDTAPITMASCTEIDGCDQTMCDYTTGMQVQVCLQCSENYYPSSILTSGLWLMQSECSLTIKNVISNCRFYMGVSVQGVSMITCSACNYGYAVNSEGKSCMSFIDINCLKLNSTGFCNECWTAYRFNGSVCI